MKHIFKNQYNKKTYKIKHNIQTKPPKINKQKNKIKPTQKRIQKNET